MTVEYATGWMLDKSIGECPWDYSGRSLIDINGYVRLEYAPMWAAVGLGAERIHDFLNEAIPAVENAIASDGKELAADHRH